MKFKVLSLLSFVLFILHSVLSAQAITTDPAFPCGDKPPAIIFDAPEAERSDLAGYTGDLCAPRNNGGRVFIVARNDGSSLIF